MQRNLFQHPFQHFSHRKTISKPQLDLNIHHLMETKIKLLKQPIYSKRRDKKRNTIINNNKLQHHNTIQSNNITKNKKNNHTRHMSTNHINHHTYYEIETILKQKSTANKSNSRPSKVSHLEFYTPLNTYQNGYVDTDSHDNCSNNISSKKQIIDTQQLLRKSALFLKNFIKIKQKKTEKAFSVKPHIGNVPNSTAKIFVPSNIKQKKTIVKKPPTSHPTRKYHNKSLPFLINTFILQPW